VLDDSRFGGTSRQTSHIGLGVNPAAVAKAGGFDWTVDIAELTGIEGLRRGIHARAGLCFATLRIWADSPERVLHTRDGVEAKNRFRRALGLPAT
jgi:hypothetical protein